MKNIRLTITKDDVRKARALKAGQPDGYITSCDCPAAIALQRQLKLKRCDVRVGGSEVAICWATYRSPSLLKKVVKPFDSGAKVIVPVTVVLKALE